MTKFGINEADFELIVSVFLKFPEISEAIIFGSRAKGNFKNGSDIDVALKGNQLSFKLISEISFILNEETILPYKFDIINYNQIETPALKDHIDRVGISIFKKK